MKKIKVNNIKKYYGKGSNLVKAIDGINLDIDIGKFTAIIGTSGSGKSTLLHCMAGLDKPSYGKVTLDNNDVYSLGDIDRAKIRRRDFGFIFQSFNLIPVLNVYDNIVLPVHLDGKKEDKDYIKKIVDKIGLDDQLNKFPNELSGGQQQRVAIARALSNKPSIIFADEPTGNLDSKTTGEVMDILTSAVKDFNQTLVMITHDEAIAKKADRVLTISDGKIISDTKKID